MQLLSHDVVLPTMGTPFKLTPLGCLHVDDDGFDEELYFETVEGILAEDHHYAVGVGDYTSLARTHYRKYLRAYMDDEDSQSRGLDPLVRDITKQFMKKYLWPLRKRLWGLAEGNHHWTFDDGITSTQLMCQWLEVPYLGVGSVHRIRVHPKNRPTDTYTLTMLVHHGDWGGGAMTTGGDLNSAEKRGQGWDVDICVFAHTHRKHGWTIPVMSPTHKGRFEIVERPRAYIRAGSFTKGYLPQCVTYVERKLLPANSLGAVTLKVQYYQSMDPTRTRQSRGETSQGITNYRPKFRVEH